MKNTQNLCGTKSTIMMINPIIKMKLRNRRKSAGIFTILFLIFSQFISAQTRTFVNPGLEFGTIFNWYDTNYGFNTTFDPGDPITSPWYTTHPSVNNSIPNNNFHPIEVWPSGLNGVPSAEGLTFVELNTNEASMIYQRMYLSPGAVITYSFKHRARSNSTERVEMVIENENEVRIANIAQSILPSSTSAWNTTAGTYTFSGTAGVYRVGFRALVPLTGGVGNFLDDIRVTLDPIIDLKFSNALSSCEGASNGTVFLRINGGVTTTTQVAIQLINPLNGTQFISDSDITLTAVTNSNGTPVITHTPGSSIYLITIPSGNYDGGATLGYSSPTNNEDGIAINISSVNDGVTEPNETFKFEIRQQGTNGSTNNFDSTSSPVLGDTYVGSTNAYFINNCVVASNPTLTKSVSPTTIVSGGTATYTFTVNNTAAGNAAQTGISFTDALPSGLRIAATPNVVVTGLTGGTTTAAAGGTSVNVSGYSIAAGATGTITVNVTNAAGQTNTTCPNAAFTNAGTNVTGVSANLTNNIGAGPCLLVTPVNASLTKSVSPSTIVSGGTATYTFTVNNSAAGNAAQTGISFTDALPSGLRIATTPNVVVSGLTGGTTTATAGGTSIGVSGYSIAAGVTGTITVNVTNAAGQTNTTCPNAAFTNANTNVTGVSANLTNNIGAGPCLIVTPIVNASLTKSVNPSSIVSGGTATYTFAVFNTAAGNTAQSGIGFTDTLPSGLRIASTPNVTINGLTGGTTTAIAGGTSITVSGYSIGAFSVATITVNVTNATGQTNAACPNPAFTNADTNITGITGNLSNDIGTGPCLIVTSTCKPAGSTVTFTAGTNNTAAGYTTVYILSDATGVIINTSVDPSGFTAPQSAGTYTINTVNYTGTLTGNTLGSNISGVTSSTGCVAKSAATFCVIITQCYNDPNTATVGSDSKFGISNLQRAGADNGNWPMVRKSAHAVLESNSKGFVITRISTANLVQITNPQEGMMVYDTTANCLKLYDGTSWSCFNTPACP